MFSFFTRRSTVVVDCFTTNVPAYELTPIVRTSRTIPQYYKDLPTHHFSVKKNDNGIFESNAIDTNLKSCYGFIEYFRRGFTIRNWADLHIETSVLQYNYFYSQGDPPSTHAPSQRGKSFEDYHHMKLISPWIFREKTGVQFLFMGAEWNLDNYNFKVLPGVVNYRTNGSTNINIMLPKQHSEFDLYAGQPLVNVIPLTEKKVVINNHLVTKAELEKIYFNPAFAYFHGWRTSERLLKDKDKKCPFGFGD